MSSARNVCRCIGLKRDMSFINVFISTPSRISINKNRLYVANDDGENIYPISDAAHRWQKEKTRKIYRNVSNQLHLV